jgi:hypothetical protein
MDITLVRSNAQRKNPRLVIFNIDGRPGSVQFFRTLFQDAIPAKLTLTGEFAAPRVKETPEERKTRLKALPKLTPAERLAKMEERVAKMKAKVAAATTPTTAPGVAAPARTSLPTAPSAGSHTRVAKGRK